MPSSPGQKECSPLPSVRVLVPCSPPSHSEPSSIFEHQSTNRSAWSALRAGAPQLLLPGSLEVESVEHPSLFPESLYSQPGTHLPVFTDQTNVTSTTQGELQLLAFGSNESYEIIDPGTACSVVRDDSSPSLRDRNEELLNGLTVEHHRGGSFSLMQSHPSGQQSAHFAVQKAIENTRVVGTQDHHPIPSHSYLSVSTGMWNHNRSHSADAVRLEMRVPFRPR